MIIAIAACLIIGLLFLLSPNWIYKYSKYRKFNPDRQGKNIIIFRIRMSGLLLLIVTFILIIQYLPTIGNA